MSKTKLKTYTVCVDIKVVTDVAVKAESFELALEQARKLQVTDIVHFDGSYNDGEIKVTGIYE